MTIENHVVSVNLAKRLKELSVPQNSIYYWTIYCEQCREHYYPNMDKNSESFTSLQQGENHGDNYSAYLATELLQWIPNEISYDDKCHALNIENQGSQWAVYYRQFLNDQFVPCCRTGENIQNTLGEIIINLIENKIIKVEDLK